MGKQELNTEEENDKMKCPVPRPILNILVKNRRTESDVNTSNEETCRRIPGYELGGTIHRTVELSFLL